MKISQNFAAFSEYMKFTTLYELWFHNIIIFSKLLIFVIMKISKKMSADMYKVLGWYHCGIKFKCDFMKFLALLCHPSLKARLVSFISLTLRPLRRYWNCVKTKKKMPVVFLKVTSVCNLGIYVIKMMIFRCIFVTLKLAGISMNSFLFYFWSVLHD